MAFPKRPTRDGFKTVGFGTCRTTVCIVVGGGNICRGEQVASLGMERVSADHMGMLATVMNALALSNSIEKLGIDTRVLSALQMNTVCEI